MRTEIEPFRAMEIVARAAELSAEGRDIIPLCIGQPDAPAPAGALAAAGQALEDGRIGYTPSPGIPALRRRLADYYGDHYSLEVDPRRIFVTTGSSAGFILAFLASFGPSARIGIPAPGYPAYRNILRALSMVPVEIETTASDRWIVNSHRLADIHSQHRLDGVLIASPNNPNGTMTEPGELRAIVRYCRENQIRFISDEIYHGLTYGMKEGTVAAMDPNAIVVNSFSKFFSMTGWRVGWMIVPQNLCETVARLQQNLFISAPELSQKAALAALDNVEEMRLIRKGYEENRNLCLRRLPEIGITDIHPMDGAFYAYCDTSSVSGDSAALAGKLLEEAGVAITPGIDFDSRRGHHFVRISYCGASSRLEEGLDRMEAFFRHLR